MSDAEYPTTDVAEIKSALQRIEDKLETQGDRLSEHAEGINAIGANMEWLVRHAEGIFQMFSNPQFMSQMMNSVAGGMVHAGTGESQSVPASGGDTPGGF